MEAMILIATGILAVLLVIGILILVNLKKRQEVPVNLSIPEEEVKEKLREAEEEARRILKEAQERARETISSAKEEIQ